VIASLVGELAPLLSVDGIELTVNIEGALSPGARMTYPPNADRAPMVHVDVADTGSGIPADVLPHVFERGFTTKPPGESHGLGLDICREIVEMHGGRIHLASAPGLGTAVHLFLPAAVAPGLAATAPRDRA
jgi:signal transduction histidine kinase